MDLPKPFNLLMPLRGNAFTVEVWSHVDGQILCKRPGDAAAQPVSVVRLFTRRTDKASTQVWVDIPQLQPQAMLEGFLRAGALIGKAVTFSATGRGSTRRDTIHIKPLGG